MRKAHLLHTCLFVSASFITTLSFAQPIHTPVSASNPYGIDFSQVYGNPIQVAEYKGSDFDGLELTVITSYKDGSITKNIQYEDGKPRLTTAYLYSEDDLLVSITGSDMSGNIRWTYKYLYDNNGKQIEEQSINASNATEWRIKSTYTASGKIKTNTTYNASDEETLNETFHYNDRGFVSADITQYPDGKLLKRIIYSYTKGGHIAQEDHYDAVGLFERVGYSYTDAGDIISFSNSGKDYSLNSRTQLQYGINGKISKETITSKDNTVTEISYVYDEYNNWIYRYDGKTYTLRKILYRK